MPACDAASAKRNRPVVGATWREPRARCDPGLALGGVVALFWGDAILDWYRGLGT